MDKDYYCLDKEEVLEALKSSKEGLTEEEFIGRSEKYGANEIKKTKGISPLKIFVRQFTSFITVILLIAIAISLLMGERLDAIVISIIVILNGLFGFIQEYKAEKAIEALKKLTALKARVIRGGIEKEIDSKDLVPGDIIVLETGSKVPADGRLIQVSGLEADESSLTGESVPSKKIIEAIDGKTTVNDQKNIVFMGTNITKGSAKAVIINTGMNTEVGKIAELVQEVKEKLTPLQEKLKQFGKWLGYVTIGICIIVFSVGVLKEYFKTGAFEIEYISEMFLAAVALAIAAIPEGLPAIVTISLALGVRKMVAQNALIRQLPAVETLGCTNVICSDKTGTLTKNEMTVRKLYTNNTLIDVTGNGYVPDGKFINEGKKIVDTAGIRLLLEIGSLCNESRLGYDEKWKIFGDPTEGALLVSAEKLGIKRSQLEKKFPQIDEIPFDSERKCMTTVHKADGRYIAYTKGAPDVILNKCKFICIDGNISELTKEDRKRILKINQDMAEGALRVLGFSYKPLEAGYLTEPEVLEDELIFVGLQAMIDPPREGAREAIARCRDAGIKTVVITGDHKLTAVAIAKELGLFKEGDRAISADELDKLSDKELNDIVEDIVIYARVSPLHKVKILSALKDKGHIVAMTGDGINDAPALKKADIGIAMGITGTDVAKEASDMVLTDDNFASIVNAVEEGRGIYSSIKQFVQYTLSSNLGEILVIFVAILMGWPLPLIAIQILWVNLLTDGLPGLALGLDPFSKDIMKKPPRKRDESIMSRDVIENIAIVGFIMMVGTLLLFYSYGIDSLKAKSIAFTVLVMIQLFNVLTYRAKNFKINIKTSRFLIGSVVITIILQLAVLYTPLNIAFKTVPLGLFDWMKILLASSILYVILESIKMIKGRLERRSKLDEG